MHTRSSSILAALALVLSLTGCPGQPGAAGGKPLERSELSTMAMGKTRAELLSTFGPPTSVLKSSPGMWYYENSRVLIDGKPHSFQLNLADGPGGKVSAFQWHEPGKEGGASFRRPYASGD